MSHSVILFFRIIAIRNHCLPILVSPETIQIDKNIDHRMPVSAKMIS